MLKIDVLELIDDIINKFDIEPINILNKFDIESINMLNDEQEVESKKFDYQNIINNQKNEFQDVIDDNDIIDIHSELEQNNNLTIVPHEFHNNDSKLTLLSFLEKERKFYFIHIVIFLLIFLVYTYIIQFSYQNTTCNDFKNQYAELQDQSHNNVLENKVTKLQNQIENLENINREFGIELESMKRDNYQKDKQIGILKEKITKKEGTITLCIKKKNKFLEQKKECEDRITAYC